MNYLINTLITGLAATAVMDVWGMLRKPLLGMPAADYRLVGRWVSYFARGRFRHDAIAKAPPMAGEIATGWVAHYLLGLAFAAAFIQLAGPEWWAHPKAWAALAFGVATVLVPFCVMQPAMGLGIAASRSPRPWPARVQSLLTHAIFGLGLYLGGWAVHVFYSTGD
jgi:hypothetical protein